MPDPIRAERDLYHRLQSPLQEWWTSRKPDDGHGERHPPLVDCCANRRGPLGRWFAPDFVMVVRNDFPYGTGAEIEVTTVEVKRWRTPSPQDIYQALAQRRGAHKAVLLVVAKRADIIEWTSGESESKSASGNTRSARARFRDVKEIAIEHGLGLVSIAEEHVLGDGRLDAGKWHEHVRPRRFEPKQRWMSRLLEMAFPRAGKSEAIRKSAQLAAMLNLHGRYSHPWNNAGVPSRRGAIVHAGAADRLRAAA